jgi:hypothetical protein
MLFRVSHARTHADHFIADRRGSFLIFTSHRCNVAMRAIQLQRPSVGFRDSSFAASDASACFHSIVAAVSDTRASTVLASPPRQISSALVFRCSRCRAHLPPRSIGIGETEIIDDKTMARRLSAAFAVRRQSYSIQPTQWVGRDHQACHAGFDV